MKFPVIILAGGLATRLKSLTKETPKALIKVANKPFIFYQLELLKQQGFTEIIISINYLGKTIQDVVGDGTDLNLKISYIEDGEQALGTGGAIKKISQSLKTPFFVMYGDSYLRVSLKEIQNSYKTKTGPLMVIYRNFDQFDISNVYLKGNNIFYCKKKPIKGSQYIDYGLSIFEKKHFFEVKQTEFDLSLIQEMYSEKGNLQFFLSKERFYEIGSMKGLKELDELLNGNK